MTSASHERSDDLNVTFEGSHSAAPDVPVEAADDLLVLKGPDIFACSARDGDVSPSLRSGHGFFRKDTRHVSELRLRVGKLRPVLVSSSASLGYAASIEMKNQPFEESIVEEQMTLSVRRLRVIESAVHERFEVRNHGRYSVAIPVDVTIASDFADVFELRGFHFDDLMPTAVRGDRDGGELRFRRVGRDQSIRATTVETFPEASRIDIEDERVLLHWDLELGLEEVSTIDLHIVLHDETGGESPRHSFEQAISFARERQTQREARFSDIASDDDQFNEVLNASVRDLTALETRVDDEEFLAAGIPWYVAPFGRDSLITSYEVMVGTPHLARRTLEFLARHRADRYDAARDAEPGKILHEIRYGDLASAGLIPHSPYYGSVDSTPLFLMVASAYYRWTNDLQTLSELLPAINSALEWIDRHGDQDGDGFVEYNRRSPGGLRNQGWKDSEDSIVFSDGSLAQGPIALAEVQAYVYLAKSRVGEIYRALDHPEVAERLEREAQKLKTAFNDAFWLDSEDTVALALDGSKQRVDSVTSNAGHCLFGGILEPERAERVVDRLMAPDMFSGWGIRTLSKASVAYNPMGYHNGSVWPHDNAIAAAGFKRYGHVAAAEAVASALFDAARQADDYRLPELYCGFDRISHLPFVPYPVACRPQAWAAGVPFLLVQTLLGISADAANQRLRIHRPRLPEWLTQLDLQDLRVGGSTLGLSFRRAGEVTAFSLPSRSGDIQVSLIE